MKGYYLVREDRNSKSALDRAAIVGILAQDSTIRTRIRLALQTTKAQ